MRLLLHGTLPASGVEEPHPRRELRQVQLLTDTLFRVLRLRITGCRPDVGPLLSPEPAAASPNHSDIGSVRLFRGHLEGGVPNRVSRNAMRPRLRRDLTVLTETPVASAICW